MICYLDKTFCPASIYKRCSKADTCPSTLTEEVIRDALVWWEYVTTHCNDVDDGPPIAQFVNDPECFKENKND